MKNELQLGVLTLVGEQAGGRIHVTVLGAGSPGQRPHCGRLTMTIAEFSSLQTLVEVLALADKRHEEDRAEIERLRASHALRDEGYATADYQAVAENIAHDPRWAVRADSQRVARWALALQQQLRDAEAAIRLYDQLGEELEQIVGGDGTSLERLRRLADERDAYRAMLCDLLASAHPHPTEHPTMTAQWARARELLKNGTAQQPRVDDESRCAVCGWTLAKSLEDGCIRGNCSMRPRPERLYAPERAAREAERVVVQDGMPPSGRWA